MIPTFETDRDRWNTALLSLPAPHVLQTWEWGEVKSQTGWTAYRLLWRPSPAGAIAAAASLLVRRSNRLPWGVAYVPKGPLVDWSNALLVEEVLAGIEAQARAARSIFVKIDPDLSPAEPIGQAVIALLNRRSWRNSAEQIQFRNTAVIDLTVGETALLERMKPKARYNVRLAERRGVRVVRGGLNDLRTFYNLYLETGERDGFLVRPFSYYEATWRLVMQPANAQAPSAHLLLADVDGEVVAGLILFLFGPSAWYMYGASSDRQRQLMPNHLLQWEAIRLAASQGCTVYDLWGAPDVLEESDPLWGVWRFKEALGARFAPHIGAWDYPVSHSLYWLYTSAMPRVLDGMRRRHASQSTMS